MNIRWTFGQKIAAGFAAVVALTLISSLVSVRALQSVVADKDRVITGNAASLVVAAKFQAAAEWRVASTRGFLLTGGEEHLRRLQEASNQAARLLDQLKRQAANGQEQNTLLAQIGQAGADYAQAADATVALRQRSAAAEEAGRHMEETMIPKRLILDKLVDEFVAVEERQLEEAKAAGAARAPPPPPLGGVMIFSRGAAPATAGAAAATRLVVIMIFAVALTAIGLSLFLSRRLGRDIGVAIQHIRSASAELQSAANQQVTSARETATSMNEISTTVSELLATSRQIADSAQRVAHISEETAGAARSGDRTVRGAHE